MEGAPDNRPYPEPQHHLHHPYDQRPHDGDRWGPWTYHPGILEHENGYYVELPTDAADLFDSIAQVAKKTWADAATVGQLVRALDFCTNLQALCHAH